MKKILISILFLSCFLKAEFQTVKVGIIDSQYKDKISKDLIISLVQEIESELESQMGMNLFDYSDSGKPIDFIYMEPSKKKIKINSLLKELEKKQKLLENNNLKLEKKEKTIFLKKEQVEFEKVELDQLITDLNNDIAVFNNETIREKELYDKKAKIFKERERKLKTKIDRWNQKNRKYNNLVSSYNQLVTAYKLDIKKYNRLQRKAETLIRTSTEVKGVAKGYTKTIYRQIEKDGKVFIDKETKNVMEKIEIYGFETLAHLKAILAHELLHLVGVGHVKSEGSLMNPILQKSQVDYLILSGDDRQAIEKSF